MQKPTLARPLTKLCPGEDFPPLDAAWGVDDPMPGLLAVGGRLDVPTLQKAYSQGVFPWFGEGEPLLWWSPEPRMVLQTANFRLHRSLRKRTLQALAMPGFEIRFDSDFAAVINACARQSRTGQSGTWIVQDMVHAYTQLHHAGYAHSVEVWLGRQLIGGLYAVQIGGMVFGESMFTHATDASKIALAALVAFCRVHEIAWIDCQQNTRHLAFMGAAEVSRTLFAQHVKTAVLKPTAPWQFDPKYWDAVLHHSSLPLQLPGPTPGTL